MSIVKTCETCGEEIDGSGYFSWNGHWYCSSEHVPVSTPPCASMTIHALKLLAHRATLHKRDEINVGDIEWAIQELER